MDLPPNQIRGERAGPFVVNVRDFSPSTDPAAGTTAGGVDCVDAASAGTGVPRVTSVAAGVADDSVCA